MNKTNEIYTEQKTVNTILFIEEFETQNENGFWKKQKNGRTRI